ncbi:MAG: DUF1743 domain-containing protein [Thermoplasmata archaeon]|nr:DUF1743 domain-containing protein [Thermoplasmata archaeon]
MWIGIDDTDSAQGGCTTYVATEVIKELSNKFDLIGFPRLVRLNPNIPWKTRGNGAIALHFGHGYGKKFEIGHIGKKIYAYEKGINKFEDVSEELEKIIHARAFLEDEKTNPAFVICRKKPSYSFYKKAVRSIVTIEEAKMETKNCIYKAYKNGRGIIGSVAAISWKPYDRTYELITYARKKWVDEESVIKMDKECKSCFDNYDYENKYIAIMPHANSPVLYGIRGEDADELKKAMGIVISSQIERWIIFETNQATDEHLQKKKIKDVKPYESVIVKGIVKKEPHVIKGGHVIFSIYDGNEIECAAYEPTKRFRNIIKKLRKGDVVVVYGGVRKKPLTINIEKIKIEKLAKVYEKMENPICPKCGKHMKSMGRGKGYRCPKCGIKAGEDKARYEIVERGIKPGFYEVPVVARRHLAKPLKRMKLS